jgi:toxin FitB
MIVVDTNIISEVMRQKPEAVVRDWLSSAAVVGLWTTSISVMEIRFGLEKLPDGRRRRELETAVETFLAAAFGDRILEFGEAAARAAASLQAKRHGSGVNVEIKDTMIAGIVVARQGILATRNTRHFHDAGIRLINPFESATA